MHLIYEDTKEEIIAVQRKAKHQPPHLHQAMELVYMKPFLLTVRIM